MDPQEITADLEHAITEAKAERDGVAGTNPVEGRHLSVFVTELEKAFAYFVIYCVPQEG